MLLIVWIWSVDNNTNYLSATVLSNKLGYDNPAAWNNNLSFKQDEWGTCIPKSPGINGLEQYLNHSFETWYPWSGHFYCGDDGIL